MYMTPTQFIYDEISFDVTGLTANHIGSKCGVSEKDIESYAEVAESAKEHIDHIRETGTTPEHTEPVLFTRLPHQFEEDSENRTRIIRIARDVRERYDNVICIGIGGSYLGVKTLFDALAHPFQNVVSDEKRNGPRVFFSGENIDPTQLAGLRDAVNLEKTKIIVTSKSGGTAEAMSALFFWYEALKKEVSNPDEHIIAITDPSSGALRELAEKNGWERCAVPEGIGGRWSVLAESTLLPAAIMGIDIDELLAGAELIDAGDRSSKWDESPALIFALLHHIAREKYGIANEVIMPYSMRLASLADWYVQLLAESLGKKTNMDGETVHAGRNPIPALGTTDMHAQTQLHQEGPYDKSITFVIVEDMMRIMRVSKDVPVDYVAGVSFDDIQHAAADANMRALADAGRPYCRISVPSVSAYTVGALLYFFELTVAYEGALSRVNAYDQPGVETYKTHMKNILKKR